MIRTICAQLPIAASISNSRSRAKIFLIKIFFNVKAKKKQTQ
jgi:hypothetical protein